MDRAGARILHSENEREAQGMESIWEKTCKGPARPPLYGKAQADVAVIGGGMTGILTALELQERGLQVVVAEAGHVGGGQTGRTTAKLTAQHGAIYAGLIERLGREKAAMYARANRRAVERCCARIELEHIDCDLERTDSWLYSYDREDALLREAEAERALGLDALARQKN
jgi:glycine/D-amino acid oxidase-like deaminating enzyme